MANQRAIKIMNSEKDLGFAPKEKRQSPYIEGGAPTIDEIKADLQVRCAGIPFTAWCRFFPDFQIPIGSHMESPLLPLGIPYGSHEVDGDGRPLSTRQVVGHDEVETFLERNGKIMEKLVHYASDGYDSRKRYPDEVLGETSDERYRWAYGIAINKLYKLQRDALEMSSS